MAKENRGGKRAAGITLNMDKSNFQFLKEFPKLEGSEKQIAWAEKIRMQVAEQMAEYTINRDSKGNPTDLYKTAVKGKKAINERIKNAFSSDAQESVKKEHSERAKNRFIDLSERISRFNQAFSNKSAKFWIENRNSNAYFIRKIDNK